MKTFKVLLPLLALLVFSNIKLPAQVGKCSNVAWNHKKPNGLMSVTVKTYSGSKRLVYGGAHPTIPIKGYKGTLDHHLEQLSFGGNLRVKLRKKGDKDWTEFYGMDYGVFYNANTYPWKTIDFESGATPEWPKGSDIQIYIDNREYGFGFTESNWGGEVMMIDLPGGGYSAGNDKFRSLVVESSNRKCVMRPLNGKVYSFSTNIEPSSALTIFIR